MQGRANTFLEKKSQNSPALPPPPKKKRTFPYYELWVTQHQLGDLTSALQSHQRALDIRIKLFGEEHASTADSYPNLLQNLLRNKNILDINIWN